MPKKKILLFLVEGPSDKTALDSLIKKIIDVNLKVSFDDFGGDILTKFAKIQTVKKSVGSEINSFMDKYGFEKKNLYKVVHLIDIDGCYIPDSNIIFNSKYTKEVGCFYSFNKIETDNVKQKINRNATKRSAIEALTTMQKSVILGTIPYEIYYFSCNLDHVLHDNPNLNDFDKVEYAYNFKKKYIDRPSDFIQFLKDQLPPNTNNLKETWNFLKKDNNSLSKSSNFYYFFSKLINRKGLATEGKTFTA